MFLVSLFPDFLEQTPAWQPLTIRQAQSKG